MADDLAVFFGHDGKRQFASVAQCTHDELLRVAGVRRIGEGGLFAKRRKTLLFNGYGDQVASLYAGMDLKKFY